MKFGVGSLVQVVNKQRIVGYLGQKKTSVAPGSSYKQNQKRLSLRRMISLNTCKKF
jgi:hypothetical protein